MPTERQRLAILETAVLALRNELRSLTVIVQGLAQAKPKPKAKSKPRPKKE